MEKDNNWYSIEDIEQLDSPALLVYPQRVKANILKALNMVADKRCLRPHVKTFKCREAVLLMMAEGITRFKCATIAEAEMLGTCQAPDVLLAYQPIGPKLQRFINVIKAYPSTAFSCITDNMVSAQQMAMAFREQGLTVPLYIDVNLGMDRTGIAPGPALVQLYAACSKMAGIRPVGLHAYDGHIRDADLQLRARHCDEAFAQTALMQKDIMQQGFSRPSIIMGGSPSFSIHSKREGIECSPGTFVYWDKGYSDLCPEQGFQPAAMVVSRVVSLPAPSRICTDLGHKSVAAENELQRRVHFLNAPRLQPHSQSEEHLVLEAGAGHGLMPGTVLYGLPQHICPTVALYERAITIENGKISGEWKTVARDRTIRL